MSNNVLSTIQELDIRATILDCWFENEPAPEVVGQTDTIQQRAIYRLLVLLRANIGTIASNGFLKMLPRPNGVQVVVNINNQITGDIVFNGGRIGFCNVLPLNMTRKYPFPD